MKKKEISPFDMALRYLSYRSRTEAEMREYLEKKSMDGTVITEVIEKLKYYGYLDDRKYIESIISGNCFGNQYGRKRLKADLKQHGIKDADFSMVDDFYTEQMEATCLRNQFERIRGRYASEPVAKQKQKISAFLQRKGFSYDMIASVIHEHNFEESKTSDDSDAETRISYYYEKYDRMYRRKGFTGIELESRIIRGLLSRGFAYDSIKSMMSMNIDDEYEEE